MVWHLILVLLLWTVESQAQFGGSERLPKLRADINKLIQDSGIQKDQLGIYIGDELEGVAKKSFVLNELKPFIPASTTKVFVAGAALEKFPLGHQFLTQLVANGAKENQVLKGHIYLKGGGDAGFVSESMWFLVNEFLRNDISVIQGDIVVDDTLFDNVRFDPGRDPKRKDRAYDAPIGAMTFNWSSVNVYVRPGSKVGGPARVIIDPENQYIKLDNKATTGKAGSGLRIQVSRLIKDDKDKSIGDTVKVTGSIGSDYGEKVYYKSITQPDYWSGYHLKEFMRQRGIEVSGTVRIGAAPEGARVLAEAKSKPVGDMVRDMMKFSNNYIAEILTKGLGAQFASPPGTMAKGLGVLREYIQSKGVSDTDYVLENPSGLSRKNRFRPQDIYNTLLSLKGNFPVFAEYLASNPIAGVDGTLKRRMRNSEAKGHVRAKTGLLNGVSGLAGYSGKGSGKEFIFVYMFNGAAVKVPRAQKLFDEISALLLK